MMPCGQGVSQAEFHRVDLVRREKEMSLVDIRAWTGHGLPALAPAPAPAFLFPSCVCEMSIKQDSHLEEVGVYFTDASCTCAYLRASASSWPMTFELMQRRIWYANEIRERKGVRDMQCQYLLLLLVDVQRGVRCVDVYHVRRTGRLQVQKAKRQLLQEKGRGRGAVEQSNAVLGRVPQHAFERLVECNA